MPLCSVFVPVLHTNLRFLSTETEMYHRRFPRRLQAEQEGEKAVDVSILGTARRHGLATQTTGLVSLAKDAPHHRGSLPSRT